MENIMESNILNLLYISVLISSIVMIIIQKFKKVSFLTKDYQIGIVNFIASFAVGIPFSMYFCNLNIMESCWVAIFAFIGAPSIYELLKNQTIINYHPSSLKEEIKEIERDDL